MRVVKVIPVVLILAILVAAGVFTFFPNTRFGPVKMFYFKMAGFTPAKTPEEALEKFKKALEKRDYDAVGHLYVTGDYKEFIDRGGKDAKILATAIDDLRSVMKSRNISSDKVDGALFTLTPFPESFKVVKVSTDGDKATAHLDWSEDLARFGTGVNPVSEKINPNLKHSLMPCYTPLALVRVDLKKEGGCWKIIIPAEITGAGGRPMREAVEALRKSAGNYKEALRSVTDGLKTDAHTKENLENALKLAIEQSN